MPILCQVPITRMEKWKDFLTVYLVETTSGRTEVGPGAPKLTTQDFVLLPWHTACAYARRKILNVTLFYDSDLKIYDPTAQQQFMLELRASHFSPQTSPGLSPTGSGHTGPCPPTWEQRRLHVYHQPTFLSSHPGIAEGGPPPLWPKRALPFLELKSGHRGQPGLTASFLWRAEASHLG